MKRNSSIEVASIFAIDARWRIAPRRQLSLDPQHMPKPPRGQSPKEGAARLTWQRNKSRAGTRKHDQSDRQDDTQRNHGTEPREKASTKTKKRGWAKASPRKTPRWRAKSKKQHGLGQGRTAESALDDEPTLRTRRQRPLRSPAISNRDTPESQEDRTQSKRPRGNERNDRPLSSSRRARKALATQGSDRPTRR